MNSYFEYEFIKHFKGLNLYMFFVTIYQRLYHWHNDFEILLLVRGSTRLSTGNEQFLLKKGDIFIVNHYEIHSLVQTSEENVIFAVQFDPAFCKNYFPDLQYIRFRNRHITKSDDYGRWKSFKNNLLHMFHLYEGNSPNFQLELMADLNILVSQLLKQLSHESVGKKEFNSHEYNLERLNRIIVHIQNNYSDKISLEDLAAQESLSTYYLSHFIRQQLGISFQEYLARVRLSKALELLASTDKSINSISLETGFSDSKYFKKHFIANYGCTPDEFRRRRNMENFVYNFDPFSLQHKYINDKSMMNQLIAEMNSMD